MQIRLLIIYFAMMIIFLAVSLIVISYKASKRESQIREKMKGDSSHSKRESKKDDII